MKKLLLIILAAAVLIGCVAVILTLTGAPSGDGESTKKETESVTDAPTDAPTGAPTEPETEPTAPTYSEGLEYVLYEDIGGYCVTGIGVCTDTDIYIPPEHEGLPVVRVGHRAFALLENIKSVTLPETVTYISAGAFNGCRALERVVLNEGLTTLELYCFGGCPSMKSITVPRSLKRIYVGAFNTGAPMSPAPPIDLYYQGSLEDWYAVERGFDVFFGRLFIDGELLEEITLPAEIAETKKYLFAGCTSLKKATVEEGAETIAGGVFYNCPELTEVLLPDSLRSLGFDVFRLCRALSEIKLPAGLEEIGVAAFSNCAITEIELPDGVKSIGMLAFGGCPIKSIVIPEGVESLKTTFELCTQLTSVTLPSTLTLLGIHTFNCCSALSDVYYGGTFSEWSKIEKESSWYTMTSHTEGFFTLHCTDTDHKYD